MESFYADLKTNLDGTKDIRLGYLFAENEDDAKNKIIEHITKNLRLRKCIY